MEHVIHFLQSQQWGVFLSFLGSGVAVAVVAQFLKRLGKLESEKVIQFMVIVLGVAGSLLQYVSSSNLQSITVLGVNTMTIVGVAQAVYLYAVKPITNFVDLVKQYQASINNPAPAAPAPAQPVAEPTPGPVEADF